MAIVGLSEFMFGYGFLYEQTQQNWSSLKAAPILPSLKKEEEEGWDAHLPLMGTDFYYQFKLSDYLTRSNATHFRDETYAQPYFRFKFHSNDDYNQHKRLRELVKKSPNTFYVVPEIKKVEEFNEAFLSSRLTECSRLIPIKDCDDISKSEEKDPHYVTFQEGKKNWKQHSLIKNHQISYFGSEIEEVYARTEQEWQTVDRDFALRIFVKVVEAARVSLPNQFLPNFRLFDLLNLSPDYLARMETRQSVLLHTSQILSILFGAVLVIVGPKADSATPQT